MGGWSEKPEDENSGRVERAITYNWLIDDSAAREFFATYASHVRVLLHSSHIIKALEKSLLLLHSSLISK